MDIYTALKKLSPKKELYARWRFNLEYNKSKEKNTVERMCEILGVKTLSEYTKWENSTQFMELMNLYLQTKFANDLEEVYLTVVDSAKQGDIQSIKVMMDMQKQIKAFNKENSKKSSKNDNVFDDLELD